MSARVRIPTPLRRFTGGAEEVGATGTTVGHIVEDLERQFPGMKERLCDEEGRVRRFVNIYLNSSPSFTLVSKLFRKRISSPLR